MRTLFVLCCCEFFVLFSLGLVLGEITMENLMESAGYVLSSDEVTKNLAAVMTSEEQILTSPEKTQEPIDDQEMTEDLAAVVVSGENKLALPEKTQEIDQGVTKDMAAVGVSKEPAPTLREETHPSDEKPLWGDVPEETQKIEGETLWSERQDLQVEPTPRTAKRPGVAPECVEVDDIVQNMRNILFNLTYEDDTHLKPEDELTVRDLLQHHPKSEEKIGCGVQCIKIKRHSIFKDVRCFWVVRTDGTETDFSYHKCLKEKVAKDHSSFVDRYDAIYRSKRARQA